MELDKVMHPVGRKHKGYSIKLGFGTEPLEHNVYATVKNLDKKVLDSPLHGGSVTMGGRTVRSVLVKVADWIDRGN